jgi:hypothetical protein
MSSVNTVPCVMSRLTVEKSAALVRLLLAYETTTRRSHESRI